MIKKVWRYCSNDRTIFCRSQTRRSELKDISKIGTFLRSKKKKKKDVLQPRDDLAIKMTSLLHKSSVSKRQKMPASPGAQIVWDQLNYWSVFDLFLSVYSCLLTLTGSRMLKRDCAWWNLTRTARNERNRRDHLIRNTRIPALEGSVHFTLYNYWIKHI